jgi:hypothetical protein
MVIVPIWLFRSTMLGLMLGDYFRFIGVLVKIQIPRLYPEILIQ